MIISDRYRYIFFEVGKTGTSSVFQVLREHGEAETLEVSPVLGFNNTERSVYGKHIPPVRVQERLGNERFTDYFRFGFVRNPFDRLVSRYFYSKLAHKRYGSGEAAGPMTLQDVMLLCQFPRLGLVIKKGGSSDKHVQFRSLVWLDHDSQLGFLSDQDGNLLVNFVGRYERLQKDYDEVCAKLGLPQAELPWLNRTHHEHYSFYYTDETRAYVSDVYRDELDRFGYYFSEV